MNRRSFLKLSGIGLAAMASNLKLSGSTRSQELRNILFSFAGEMVENEYDWYIDSVSGNDDNDGLTSSTPLRTIARLMTKPIAAGQTVGLRCGSVFRETLAVPSSGQVGSPITYKSYDSGAAPRILGSNTLSNWTQTDIPAVSADILSESFETTKPTQNGYDAGAWTEHIGEGCSIDSDDASIPRPDGSSQVLLIQKASPGYTAETVKDLGSEHPTCYTSIYIYIASEGLSSGDSVWLLRERTASGADVMGVSLYQSGEQLRFRINIYNNGWTDATDYSVHTGRWYLVSLKYDYTHKTYEMCVNWVPIDSGALTGALRTGVQFLNLGDSSHSKILTAYFDAFQVSSANYPTAAVALPANCYKASINGVAGELYFELLTGKIRRGLAQTAIGSCTEEFQWYYHINGYVVLYSPTNPGARYSAIEGGVRKNCITHNNQTYIIIDGLEVAYSLRDTISVASNWTVQYCNSHHASRVSILAGGYYGGIYGQNASNCTVRFCTIHDHPCKGTQFEASLGASVSGNLIEHNVFYDNSDYSIDCQVFEGGNAHAGLLIQYNEFYTTPDWERNTTGASAIFTRGRPGYPMVGPVVRYNLFHDLGGNGVQVGPYVNGMQIYNNTFARTLSGYDGISNGIFADPAAEPYIIKNNIGYRFNYQMYIPDKTEGSEVDYNCWYTPGTGFFIFVDGVTYRAGNFAAYQAATGWDAHGVWADPLLVSATDLSLQSGSPCIDAGIYVGIDQDFTGKTVGNPPEIGAYEYEPPKEHEPATVVLSNLNQVYDGSPKDVSASTTPPGLTVSLLYTGTNGTIYGPSSQAPANAGSYSVEATIEDSIYYGSAFDILVIAKANATIVLDHLDQVYDGSPKPVSAITVPPGLNVSITYSSFAQAPIDAGFYTIEAIITDPNYSGSTLGTLAIAKASATIELSDLNQVFDGKPKPVTVLTFPPELSVSITYTGTHGISYGPSTTAPTQAGIYQVEASITDPNYQGSASSTLAIIHKVFIPLTNN